MTPKTNRNQSYGFEEEILRPHILSLDLSSQDQMQIMATNIQIFYLNWEEKPELIFFIYPSIFFFIKILFIQLFIVDFNFICIVFIAIFILIYLSFYFLFSLLIIELQSVCLIISNSCSGKIYTQMFIEKCFCVYKELFLSRLLMIS